MAIENTVIKERLAALRAKMAENGIDYYMMPTSDFHSLQMRIPQYSQLRKA